MLSHHLLPLCTIVAIQSLMCIFPKFIIDWFMILVLLVLKLFVSSRPLKLEGVLCIYVLLFHEGQVEKHFAMSFYMIWTHTWLSMFHYSWSFICVAFHVITWLLSFYCQDYVSYAHVLSTLNSALNALHRWSRLWWCMSPQKLFFCYYLPTRGWAGVKLGDAWYVSNVSIIFDASCLFMHHLLCVLLHFVAFLCNF
jgi:hypothetical protein